MFRITANVAAILLALACSANASVVYTLTDQQYDGESAARGATLSVTLTINDQALEQGSFSLNEHVSLPGTNYGSGDVSNFESLFWSVGSKDRGGLTPTSGSFANLVVSLVFTNGVPTGTLSLHGETSEFALSGISGVFTGTVASDFNNCNDTQGRSRCRVTGTIVEASDIPEPTTFTLLCVGLLSFYHSRCRVPRIQCRSGDILSR